MFGSTPVSLSIFDAVERPDAVDVGEPDLDALVEWEVDACDSCHLALPLLVPGVRADDQHDAAPPNDPATLTHRLYGRSYLHRSSRWVVSNQLRRRPTGPMNRAHRHTKTALRPTENGSRARLISRLATHDPPRDPNGPGFGPDSLRALPPADPPHQGAHEHNRPDHDRCEESAGEGQGQQRESRPPGAGRFRAAPGGPGPWSRCPPPTSQLDASSTISPRVVPFITAPFVVSSTGKTRRRPDM